MKYSSKDVAFLLAGGYSLLGSTTEIAPKVERTTEKTTPLGASEYASALTGLKKGSFAQKGFFDDAAGGANAALKGLSGTPVVLAFGVEGNVAGKALTGMQGPIQADYERILELGKLHRANAAYVVSGAVEEGVILKPLSTVTTGGDTQANAVDNGAASTGGGSAYLQVTALTLGGHTGLNGSVLHSADNVTYAGLLNFAAVTAAPAAERKTVAGTVNRYLVAGWAFSGAGTSPSATLMIGFARG